MENRNPIEFGWPWSIFQVTEGHYDYAFNYKPQATKGACRFLNTLF